MAEADPAGLPLRTTISSVRATPMSSSMVASVMSFDSPFDSSSAVSAALCDGAGIENGRHGAQDEPGHAPPAAGSQHVVSLIYCPEVPTGTRYELARRDGDGTRRALFSGVLTHSAPSLNLARIRYRGACLGANEVVLVLP